MVARRAKNAALPDDRARHLDVNSAYRISESGLVWVKKRMLSASSFRPRFSYPGV
jgi:hypothetical protein